MTERVEPLQAFAYFPCNVKEELSGPSTALMTREQALWCRRYTRISELDIYLRLGRDSYELKPGFSKRDLILFAFQHGKLNNEGDALAEQLMEEPGTITRKELAAKVKLRGVDGNAAYNRIKKAVEDGILRQTGPHAFNVAGVDAFLDNLKPKQKPRGIAATCDDYDIV